METVRSIERAFAMLRSLSVHPATMSELADAADLAKSTAARILFTLEQIGVVDRDDAGRFHVAEDMAQLGQPRGALVIAIRPYLADLSSATGEAAGLGLVEGDVIQHVVQEEAPNAVQVMDFTGHSVPLHVSPGGLCVLAHLTSAEVDRYLEGDLAAYTSNTICDPDLIRARLGDVRTVGFMWAIGEFADGLTSVAAPLFDAGHEAPVGALTVHGPSYRFPGDNDPDGIGRLVVSTAERFRSRRGR